MEAKNQEYIWKESSSSVYFVRSKNDDPYHIELNRLDKIRKTHEYCGIQFTNISDWVVQLKGKSWIQSNHLSELAHLIQKQRPENKIDWVQTLEFIDVVAQRERLRESIQQNKEL
jgi:hypothetical protein